MSRKKKKKSNPKPQPQRALSPRQRIAAEKSYAAYEKHYSRLQKTHSMKNKYSFDSYIDALGKVRIEAKSSKNLALNIARGQEQVDYEFAREVQRRLRAGGKEVPTLKELYTYNKMTYTLDGEEHTAKSSRQALYMSLVESLGWDFANESFGY